MSAVLVLINIVLALVAVVLIVSVLAQEGTRQGLGSITGGAETFFGKNKARSIEGKLEMITKIGAAVFIVFAIVSTMLTSRLNNNAAPSDDTIVNTQDDGTVSEGTTDDVEGETVGDEADVEGEDAPVENDTEGTEAPVEGDTQAEGDPAENNTEDEQAPADGNAEGEGSADGESNEE